MSIVGVHAPNAALTQDDLRVVRLLGAPSVKLMHTAGTVHTPADLITLRSHGAEDFTVRVPDTREPGGRYPSAYEYAEQVAAVVRLFYPFGVRRFQVDNEPNVPLMWDSPAFGPWQYQFFMRHVVHLLRANVPPGVVLVSPPLSYSPALWRLGGENPTPFVLDDWLAAYHWTDGGRLPSLWRIFDEVGANVYWQSLRQMADPSYGLAYDQLHARSGHMRVCVLEFGNSATRAYDEHGQPKYTLDQANEMRRAQYPEWLAEAAAGGYVSRTYAYIGPGATEDWADYRLTDTVAASMAYAGTLGDGRALGGGRGIV